MNATSMSAAIAGLGYAMGPQVVGQCRALFGAEQEPIAERLAPVALDCAYGPDPRHRLDLYREGGMPEVLRPVVLFVHGGGFLLGDKGGESGWANAHVGRWAAMNGMLGAVMNYRLAPAHMFPSGGEDVAKAVDWLRTNAARFGGDPQRILLVGTSAGSVHLASFMKLREDHASLVRGAVLLSGLYGYTPLDERDELYYGPQALYAQRMPREAVAATGLPLLIACAQFDPPHFQAEWAGLLQERLERHGRLPRCHYASGHNHYSLAMHIGTADRRLTDEMLAFFADLA